MQVTLFIEGDMFTINIQKVYPKKGNVVFECRRLPNNINPKKLDFTISASDKDAEELALTINNQIK
jgi:hypothetical protein